MRNLFKSKSLTFLAIAAFIVGGFFVAAPLAFANVGIDRTVEFTPAELTNNWGADRTFPTGGVTSVTAFGRDNVASTSINSSLTASGGFNRTEGIKTKGVHNLGNTAQVDLYIDPAWANTAVRAGFWVIGGDDSALTANFGVVEFVNSEDCAVETDCSTHISNRPNHEGFRIYNGETGDWKNVATAFEYGTWVTLGVELDTVAGEYIYYINGVEVGTAPGGGSFIRELFLQSYNYGLDKFSTLNSDSYTTHWSNLGYIATFNTIQDAITAANPNDTINVADGIYNLTSRIDVNKAVSIIGDISTSTNVVINAPVAGGTQHGQNSVFVITSNDVTIRGFKIQGALHTAGTAQNAGIYVDDPNSLSHPGLSNITISNNEITENGYGIVVQNIRNSTISNNKIYNNKKVVGKESESGVGIIVYGDATGNSATNKLTIDNNDVYNNETEGIRVGVGAETGPDYITVDLDTTISNNTIYNNGSTIGGIDKYIGIKSSGFSNGVTVSGNEIYNHTGTTISATSGNAGIQIHASKNWTVSNNNIHDNLNGIAFANSTYDSRSGSHAISNNDIHANVRGISIDDGTEAVANNKNSIYSNDSTTFSGIGFAPYNVYNSGSGTFDTTNNWWGSSILAEILAKVSGLADSDFTPWYINPGRTILSTAISSGGGGSGTITVTTPTIDFAEISDGAVDLGVSNLALGNESVLDLANSTNSITLSEGENPVDGIIIAGTFKPLSSFMTGDMVEQVDLSEVQNIGGEDVLVEQAIQLSSGTPGTPTVLTNSSLSNVSVSIPDDTTILAPKGWDGTIAPPTDVPSDDGTAPSGFSVGDTVIEVGSPDVVLLFDKAVKITLTGVTGTVGYKPAGSDTWKTITTQCTDAEDHGIAFPGECYSTVGGDTIIWTYHFTSFGEFIPDPTPAPSTSSGGGYAQTACADVTYSEWGTVIFNGLQYRTVLSQTPNNCSLSASQIAAESRPYVASVEPVSSQITPVSETPQTSTATQQVLGVKVYADGTLLKGTNNKIYVVKGNALQYISSLKELAKYKGAILRVTDETIASFATTAVLGEKKYADGTLLRGTDNRIYVLIGGKLQYIPTLKELAKYKRAVLRVTDETIASFATTTVLGVKKYANGTLIKAKGDAKIYVIKDGKKVHIKSLAELKQYKGKTLTVEASELNSY